MSEFAMLLGAIAMVTALAALWLASESSRRAGQSNQALMDLHLKKSHEMLAAYDRKLSDLTKRQDVLIEELKRLKGDVENKIHAMDVTIRSMVQDPAAKAQASGQPKAKPRPGMPPASRSVQ